MMGFVFFWMLCYTNLIDIGSLDVYEIFLSTFVVIQMLVKVNYFLRVYDKYGLLVTLITTCIQDIVPFTAYFMVWEVFFVTIYKISGIKAPARKGLSGSILMFVYVFENSIGNINDPDFPENLSHA